MDTNNYAILNITIFMYSKTCLKRPLKITKNKDRNNKW